MLRDTDPAEFQKFQAMRKSLISAIEAMKLPDPSPEVVGELTALASGLPPLFGGGRSELGAPPHFGGGHYR